ncbi:MAG: DUF2927 domain-containing protein [Gammaproteobacteria bacterium]|nr:DUF2927 domain-containing protein [Gammaproteobacteria bacterium]
MQAQIQVCFLLITLLYSPITSSQLNHWQSTDYIITSFIDIALNNEYSHKNSSIRKWSKPIYYQIIHRTGDQALHEKLTKTHIEHLANITGLVILPASLEHHVNLKIIFSSEQYLQQELQNDFLLNNKQEIKQLAHHGVCLGNFTIDAKSNITKAIVIIPVDRARAHAKLLSCIVEELTQVLGLPNDSDKVFPSIFNDKSRDDYLSGLDFVLLKALYHSSLTPGMNIKQVKHQLESLLARPEFQRLIMDSEQIVNQQGLYPLLN